MSDNKTNAVTASALSYADAGVNKEEGYRAVEKMKESVAATQGPQVLGGLGSFASLYALQGWKEPVLVSGTDGVGTKLRLALDTGRFETIGRDCYAMVANDILCHGARPLFFLDCLACGKLNSDVAAGIVSGMAQACQDDDCALVGGETAEMPGFYTVGDYDVAGFAVGAVERSQLIDGSNCAAGDIVIGLSSDGAHSNGYSLIRSLFPEPGNLLDDLLTATRLYGTPVRRILDAGFPVKGMAHITGGGIPENLPRAFAGTGLEARVDTSTWNEPSIFGEIRKKGVSEHEMRGTFNMGIGFCLIVPAEHGDTITKALKKEGETAMVIGELRNGSGGVCYA